MANKAISELPQAQNVNNQDLFVLEQSGIAKKLTAETFITEQGIIDALAEALDGHGGIQSVTLSSVSGRIRTYRITFTDQSATTFQVYDGTSIDRISRTSSSGLDDVYTIFLSDGTTTFFTVHNGADGTVSEAMLNDALKDKAPAVTETTESSAIANFTDGADNMVMHNVIAEINPVQDLTYGAPYPAGGGVNQWDEEWEVGSLDSSTGLPVSSSTTIRSKNFCPCVGGASYYVKCANYTDIYALCVYWYDADKTYISRVWAGAQTTTAPTNARYFKFVTNTSGTVYGATYNHDISINYPATVTAYFPFSNICPITGWTGCNVTRTGINVWDEEWELGYIAPSTGAKMDATNRIRSKNYIPVAGGQSYFIKMYGAAACYDRNKSYISSVPYTTIPSVGYALNIPENARYILFSMSAPYGTTYNHDISINYPSSDYDYHAYQGSNTVTVDWTSEAGTVYGGTIDVATGVLTVDRAYKAFSELVGWQYRANQFDVSISDGMPQAEAGKPSAFITDTYATKASGTSGSYSNETCAWQGASTNQVLLLRVRDSSFTSVTDFLAARGNVNICYELATPQTYQLTPQEVKTLLGTNNVWADTGNVSVTYPADTKMFIEKLTMPTEDDLVANQAITSGKYFMIGNSLYLALANIASGAQITIGTNAQRVSLADALNTINA